MSKLLEWNAFMVVILPACCSYPECYRLICGRWASAAALMTHTVRAAQERGVISPGDPHRLSALLRSAARGLLSLKTQATCRRQGRGR